MGTQTSGPLQQFLHAQRRSNLDSGMRDVRPSVAEPVGHARWNTHRFPGTGEDAAAADSKAHPARDDGEALLLNRVDVAGGHVATRTQEQIEGQHASAGLGTGLANNDPLAADRVVDDTSLNPRLATLSSHDIRRLMDWHPSSSSTIVDILSVRLVGGSSSR